MADDLFSQAVDPNPELDKNSSDAEVNQFLDKYVGEGKRYKDVEELAKSKHFGDEHINRLEGELSSLREFMTAQFEDMAAKRSNPNPDVPNDADKDPKPDPVAPPKANEEDLDARIAKAMEERDENRRLANNAELTQEVMIDHFGSQANAVKALQDKAEEMGVNPQFLADTAFRSPKAFFNLMGINPEDKPRNQNTPASSPDVNPRVLEKTGDAAKQGTYGYYDQLRRTDPKRYWSDSVQKQMMADALAKGQDFFRK